jgi:hypothetical protein
MILQGNRSCNLLIWEAALLESEEWDRGHGRYCDGGVREDLSIAHVVDAVLIWRAHYVRRAMVGWAES